MSFLSSLFSVLCSIIRILYQFLFFLSFLFGFFLFLFYFYFYFHFYRYRLTAANMCNYALRLTTHDFNTCDELCTNLFRFLWGENEGRLAVRVRATWQSPFGLRIQKEQFLTILTGFFNIYQSAHALGLHPRVHIIITSVGRLLLSRRRASFIIIIVVIVMIIDYNNSNDDFFFI